MGCNDCKKKNDAIPVKSNATTLFLFFIVVVFFLYGLISLYFDILSFF